MSKGGSNFLAGIGDLARDAVRADGARKSAPVTLPKVSLQGKPAPQRSMPDLNAGKGIGRPGPAPRALKPHDPHHTTPHPRVVDDRGEQSNFGEAPSRALMRGGEPV